MRIALLTDGIHPYVIGGMQKHSLNLVKYFAQNKIFVDLYHTNKSRFDIDKLELFSDDEKKYIRPFVVKFPQLPTFPGHYIVESYWYSFKIFQLFKTQCKDVDFIYAKGFSAWRLLNEKRKGFKCAPIALNFHGYEMFQKAPDLTVKIKYNFLLRVPVMINVAKADFLISYGGKITGIIRNLVKDDKKIIEIPSGIERSLIIHDNEIQKLNNPIKFIFIGRFERRKGVEELNKVIIDILGKENFEFHFVGNIPKEKQISSDKIRYHGVIWEEGKILELLRSCDVLVCPSFSEGMPNVILEGMASGVAVVATNVGAVNEMVSKDNGILLESVEINALRNALLYFINIKEDELLKMKKKSLEIARSKFTWPDIIERTISQIKKNIKVQS